jgi:hypothetical protein
MPMIPRNASADMGPVVSRGNGLGGAGANPSTGVGLLVIVSLLVLWLIRRSFRG